MSGKVTAEMVKELRDRTGVGMGKCKEALDQAGGDMKKRLKFSAKLGWPPPLKKKGVRLTRV